MENIILALGACPALCTPFWWMIYPRVMKDVFTFKEFNSLTDKFLTISVWLTHLYIPFAIYIIFTRFIYA